MKVVLKSEIDCDAVTDDNKEVRKENGQDTRHRIKK